MALNLAKMAPTAVVVAFVGYGCWSYRDGSGSTTPVPAGGKLPEIRASLLSPTIPPAPNRDPFGTTTQAPMDLPEGGKPATAAVDQHLPAARTGQDSAPGASGTAPPGTGGGRAAGKADSFSGWALNATYIQGDRRIAVINGRPYAQGESLSAANSTSDPYIVEQIQPYKVLLACQGQLAELTYPDLARAPSPSHQAQTKLSANAEIRKPPLLLGEGRGETRRRGDAETRRHGGVSLPASHPSPEGEGTSQTRSQAIAESTADREGEALHE